MLDDFFNDVFERWAKGSQLFRDVREVSNFVELDASAGVDLFGVSDVRANE